MRNHFVDIVLSLFCFHPSKLYLLYPLNLFQTTDFLCDPNNILFLYKNRLV